MRRSWYEDIWAEVKWTMERVTAIAAGALASLWMLFLIGAATGLWLPPFFLWFIGITGVVGVLLVLAFGLVTFGIDIVAGIVDWKPRPNLTPLHGDKEEANNDELRRKGMM